MSCGSTCSIMGHARAVVWLFVVCWLAMVNVSQQQDSDYTSVPDAPSRSCYTGIAQLKRTGPNECLRTATRTRFLTSPMDFSTDLPWDCLDEVIVSVSGCKVSFVSVLNTSRALPDFSCSWLEYQGLVQSDNVAEIAAWVRPISVSKWILYNTNLTTWRARGTATVTLTDLERAVQTISRRDPNLPVSVLLNQPEIMSLRADSMRFQQQLQQQDMEQQTTDTQCGGRRRLSRAAKQRVLQQAGSAGGLAATQTKRPLPPGIEADIGNGLVSEPVDWQQMLADLYTYSGSLLIGVPEDGTIVLYNNRRCNITYEVQLGGLLGVGRVDPATVAMFSMPAIEPYQPPNIMDIDRQVLAAAAAYDTEDDTAPDSAGPFKQRGAWIALVVALAVLGAGLLGALVYLAVRLFRAPKAAAAAGGAVNGISHDGRVSGIAMSPLEQQTRVLGPSGGI